MPLIDAQKRANLSQPLDMAANQMADLHGHVLDGWPKPSQTPQQIHRAAVSKRRMNDSDELQHSRSRPRRDHSVGTMSCVGLGWDQTDQTMDAQGLIDMPVGFNEDSRCAVTPTGRFPTATDMEGDNRHEGMEVHWAEDYSCESTDPDWLEYMAMRHQFE